MQPPEANPQPPEGINSPSSSGLGEFTKLVLGLGLAAVVITVAAVAGVRWIAPHIPFAWEKAIAAGVAPVESPPDAEAQQALRELSNALAGVADLPPGVSVRVHLSDHGTPNAFATLGGHIVVTRGLVEAVSSENALAMVIAHEIAHVSKRHPIQALGRGAVLQIVWSAIAGATGQAAVQRVLGKAGLLTVLRFNREMEREADRAALATLERYYGHTQGAAEFFQRLQARDDSGAWADFLRTHPRPGERQAAIEAKSQSDNGGEPKSLPPALQRLREGAGAR